MNVLSLFDGCSGGQQALERAGIKYNKYYASEIDKFAIQVTQHNYPDTIQLGSVVDVDVTNLEPIDLLIGGSPCQSFSFAGKRNGMTTSCNEEIFTLERYLELKADGFQFEGESYLFWEYMRILTDIRKYNPNVLFLLENVEMGAKWERVLSEAIGIYGVHINSALVSAQNRKRIYWTNIRVKEVGLFGELHSDIPQPEDRGILLKDILEDEVDEKYYLSDNAITRLSNNDGDGFKSTIKNGEDKSSTILSTQHKLPRGIDLICCAMRGREAVLTPKRTEYGKAIRKDYEAGKIKEQRKNIQRLEPRQDGKTNTLTSVQKDNLVVQLKQINDRVDGVSFNEEGIRPYRNDAKKSGIQELGTIGMENTKSSCVTSVHSPKVLIPEVTSKDNLAIQLNPSKESGGKQPYQHNRIYDADGISPCLNTDARSPAILIPEATSKGYVEIEPGECFDAENINSKTRRGRKMVNKSNCLMAKETDFMRYEGIEFRKNYAVIGDGYEQDNRAHYENGKSGTLDLKSKARQKVLLNDARIRRLTPLECERLQTMKDNFTAVVSDSQRYKMIGNGWTIDVIAHIFSFINDGKTR